MSSGTSVPHTPRDASGPSPTPSLLDRCLAALTRRPGAIITDIDGTISRIVARPEDATVSSTAKAALDALSRSVDLVAVITARDEATARRMVGAAGVTYVGNYGLDSGASVAGVDGVSQARSAVGPLLKGLPCVTVEDKGVAFSLHYRNCDDPGAVRLRLLDIAGPIAAAAGARILEGKRVIEVVPGRLPDKRSAFSKLVDAQGIRGLIYFGDDLSDVLVFEEIARRRSKGLLEGLGIAVVDVETDTSVREAADTAVDGVGGVERLLTDLASGLLESEGANGG